MTISEICSSSSALTDGKYDRVTQSIGKHSGGERIVDMTMNNTDHGDHAGHSHENDNRSAEIHLEKFQSSKQRESISVLQMWICLRGQ